MVSLFGAVPGGPELLIVLLVFVLLFGVPLAIILLGGGALGAKLLADSNSTADSGTDERIDRLEEELAQTKAELRELRERNADDADESDQTESRSP